MLKFIFFEVILSFVILSFVIQIMLFLLSLYFVLFFLGVLIYFLWFNIVLHFENSFLIEKQVISPQVHKIKYNAQYLQMIGLFYCLHSHPHNFSPPNNSFVTLDKFLIFSQLLQFTIYWSFLFLTLCFHHIVSNPGLLVWTIQLIIFEKIINDKSEKEFSIIYLSLVYVFQ